MKKMNCQPFMILILRMLLSGMNDTIECLINEVGNDDFYTLFDNALERISDYPQNEEFSIDTADGGRKPLFTRITENVEVSKRNNFAKNIFGIISQDKFDFGEAFKNNFDFYSAIFEYLIKDYNVASGVYAEYFYSTVRFPVSLRKYW